jgi:TolB-like protein
MNLADLPDGHQLFALIVSGAGRKRVIRSLNIWWAAWALAAALSVAIGPHGVSAQDAKRVVVLDFKGPNASSVQTQVVAGLKSEDSIELVSAREAQSAADRAGVSLNGSSGYKQVGEALDVAAFVTGDVKKQGHRLQATVRVYNASNGQEVHEETWSRRSSALKTIKPTVWTALGPAIEESSAPAKKTSKATKPSKQKPPPPPPPEEEEEEEEEEAPPPRATRKPERQPERDEEEQEPEEREEKPKKRSTPGDKSAAHPALVASLGPRIMWRTLQYEGSPSSTNFQTYSSSDEGTPSFNVALGAQWYPGAHSRSDWVSDLGLDFDLDYALGLKAKVAESNREVKVSAFELGIGAIYRIPLEAFEPRIRIGYVKHVFDVDLDTMPGLSYNNIRFNVGTAINLVDWLSFDVNFGYLVVLGVGELSDDNYGEDVQTKAFEAGGGALVKFTPEWGARFALDYRRYKYDFGLSDNPDTVLPKSGTDAYLRLTLAAVYTLPGQK